MEEALDYCGTLEYLNHRAELNERLLAHGALIMDVQPSALGADLVTKYLERKKAGAL
jgi:uncharacterized protein (DUF58 family)